MKYEKCNFRFVWRELQLQANGISRSTRSEEEISRKIFVRGDGFMPERKPNSQQIFSLSTASRNVFVFHWKIILIALPNYSKFSVGVEFSGRRFNLKYFWVFTWLVIKIHNWEGASVSFVTLDGSMPKETRAWRVWYATKSRDASFEMCNQRDVAYKRTQLPSITTPSIDQPFAWKIEKLSNCYYTRIN